MTWSVRGVIEHCGLSEVTDTLNHPLLVRRMTFNTDLSEDYQSDSLQVVGVIKEEGDTQAQAPNGCHMQANIP